jgi:hypothetical protein
MQEEKIVTPPGVTKVYNFMIAEQDVINKRRIDVVRQLWYAHFLFLDKNTIW